MAGESPAVNHLPYQTQPIRLGLAGVNLAKSVESLDPNELARLTNGIPGQGGGIDTRPGLTLLASLNNKVNVHTVAVLNDARSLGSVPLDAGNLGYTRFWGVDDVLGRAALGAINVMEGGFSGSPLSLVPWQTELSGEPWMYIADSNKMRKASRTSASLPIGLSKAAQPVTVAVAETRKIPIAAFNASDNTQANKWTTYGDIDTAKSGTSGVPVLGDVAPGATAATGSSVAMSTVIGGATTSYVSTMYLVKRLDLSTFGGGVAATDDDIIHWWMRLIPPDGFAEIRLYFIVGAFTAPLKAIPFSGSPGASQINTSSYMRAFRPSDYAQFIASSQTALAAAQYVRQNRLLEGFTDPLSTAASDPSEPTLPGALAWSEFGKIGLPVRRSDFVKIGSAGQPGFTWADITAIMITVQTVTNTAVAIGFDDLYLTGGGNVDSSEPDAQAFDYRVVDYDKKTGARSNPSDVMATTIEALRQRVNIQPVAKGQINIIQEAYRRGGTLTDNWYFAAQNAVDGQVIVDNTDDITALAAGPVDIDHDQPITTADIDGTTIRAQPVPILFGPIEGYLFALGDPYRPGDLYWCKRNEPDHWPSANHEAVCAPSEPLMNGGKYASQGFCLSTKRLYSVQVSITEGSVTTLPTDCTDGLYGRWAMAIGPGGIYFGARDGVRVTQGGSSLLLSDNLRPLFRGQAKNGYNAIDMAHPETWRLRLHGDDLWFGYQDSAAQRVWWVYSLTYKTWRFVKFAVAIGNVHSDDLSPAGLFSTPEALTLIACGATNGKAYTHAGLTDDVAVIPVNVRTGALDFGRVREEKLLGDLAVYGNLASRVLTVQCFLDSEKTAGNALQILGNDGYDRYIKDGIDLFGAGDKHATTVSVDLSWNGDSRGAPSVQQLGLGVAVQPEVTQKRATTWQPLNESGEAYLTGCWIDSDTSGVAKAVTVEGLLNGAPVAIANLVVNSNGGRKQWFSWVAVHVDMVRLRPTDGVVWELFGQGWLATPEPPRIAVWDSGFETLGDTYYTGLDLEVDTFNQVKSLDIYADGVKIVAATPIQANGRSFIHITLPAGRAHIYRFVAIDANLGLLYTHKWITEAEPGEQTNWNQNYTIAGTLGDKWLKGILVEADTFGLQKQIEIQVDGVAQSTQQVTTNGRKVVHIAFAQVLGRVFRIMPTDANPGRLYSLAWLFDEEPYQLTRYETQEIPHGVDGWLCLLTGQIALKSTDVVNMRVIAYGQAGQTLSDITYPIVSTGGVKTTMYVPLQANKGIMYKYIFTSSQGFWLYQEESFIEVQPVKGGPIAIMHPFGNDDVDPTRDMTDPQQAAQRPGGTAHSR